LCCPVDEAGIWRGWLAGLKRTYLAPLSALVVFELVILLTGVWFDGWWNSQVSWALFAAGTALFVADVYVASWMGLWQGVAARTPARACLSTVFWVLMFPGVLFLGFFGLAGLLGGFTDVPAGLLVTVWFVVGGMTDAAVGGRAMLKLSDEFRAAAARGGKETVRPRFEGLAWRRFAPCLTPRDRPPAPRTRL
jgi:hypothetical protein